MGSGLHVFPEEGKRWLEAIAFWKIQTKFFGKVLSKKGTFVSEYGKMLKDLGKIYKTLFEYVTDDIIKYEQILSFLY